jgi:hypothetical protein
MKIVISIILIFSLIIGCRTKNKEVVNKFTADYFIDSYYYNPNGPDEFIATKYYDSTDKLLREVTRDGLCIQYRYLKNQLIETITSRNCINGRRTIFIYDSLGNHLGNYITMDSVIDLGAIGFEQTKFYDDSNRLIKEKVSERKTTEGEVIETWNLYKYDSTLKKSLEVKNNNITTWLGTYKYDSAGKIIELKKTRNERYEIDIFKYNNIGQLVETVLESNEVIETPMGTFNKPERRTIFKYDSTNFLYEETIYDNDKFVVRTINKKSEFKNKNQPTTIKL